MQVFKNVMKKIKGEVDIDGLSDYECLELVQKLLTRVSIGVQFIQNEDSLITHEVVQVRAGEHVLLSDPYELDWPLQPLPMPDALKEKAH